MFCVKYTMRTLDRGATGGRGEGDGVAFNDVAGTQLALAQNGHVNSWHVQQHRPRGSYWIFRI